MGVRSQAKKKKVLEAPIHLGVERLSYSKPPGFAYRTQLSNTFP